MDEEVAGLLDDGWSVDDIAAWEGCSREVRVRLADRIAARYSELMSR
jgi:hypothetical protein